MAAQLQIKRAASATANSAPSGNLAAGELAVSYGNAPAHDNGGGDCAVLRLSHFEDIL